MSATHANVSVIFVPPKFAKAAVIDAINAKMPLVVVITEGIPVHDSASFYTYAQSVGSTQIIGPNCPGLISPGKSNVGIIPADITGAGPIGLVSKSGTLTYESVGQTTALGLGQTTCIGIGGDPIGGMSYIELLQMFEEDPETEGIIMIGEIGGDLEIRAAEFVKHNIKKPVAGFIAGQTAPKGKRMGHAGAIISGSHGTASEKMDAMRAAGITVAESPGDIGKAIATALSKHR